MPQRKRSTSKAGRSPGGLGRRSIRPRRRVRQLSAMRDEELLNLRFSDLDLRIKGTKLAERLRQLYAELKRRGIGFRPHIWLSTEWFSPDFVPGIAAPFYLAHPRLMKLEERQMFDVEGGSNESCMRILRHEAGHAIDTAYKLSERMDWQRVFGKPTRYPKTYQPRPYSKKFVLHLDMWYAQSHPSEDFAETFAVWLRPRSQWRRRYKGWPAFRKLEFVDKLMKEIAGARPIRSTRRKVEPLQGIRMTLREHYARKRQRYGATHPEMYDRDLQLLFSNHLEGRTQTASQFLRRARPDLRRMVSKWTGEYQYTIDQVLAEMISRSQDLKLRAPLKTDSLLPHAAVLLAVQTMNYLHGGGHKVVI